MRENLADGRAPAFHRPRLAAMMNAMPLNANASNIAVVSFPLCAPKNRMALGRCTRNTQLKIMIPVSAPARRLVFGMRIPTAPAASAVPAKYVQNRRWEIQAARVLRRHSPR